MALSSPRLRRFCDAIDALVADTEVMLPSQLDGYLTGVAISPDPIPPSEWLPQVWTSGDPEADAAIFEDAREAQWYEALVIEHHDAIKRALDKGRGRYQPFLEEDVRSHEIMWEVWIEGLQKGLALRAEVWPPLGNSEDKAVREAIAGLMTLMDIAFDACDLERPMIDALTEDAPALIPGWIETLHATTAASRPALLAVAGRAPPAKIGRNDPCPCGSGKKYKKCCAATASAD